MRLAIVQPGELVDGLERLARRLAGSAITAVVDSDPARAARIAGQLGGVVTAATAQELHEQHDGAFDTWLTPTPVGLLVTPHANKPLQALPEQWTELPGGWLWGHQFRFQPSVRTIKECLDAGKLGSPGLVRIHHWQQATSGDVRHSLAQQLDVACWLMDQRPTVLMSYARPKAQPGLPSRYAQVHLGFADDRMAVIDCGGGLDAGNAYYSLSVIGSAGAAYADDHHNAQLIFRGDRPQAAITDQGDHALLAALQEYVDSRKASRPPSCGAAAWQRATNLVKAVDQSLASGEAVRLTEGGDR